ncbi:MAG: hypothetical protein AAF702_49190 [Chloroflexota bacterium]
MQNIIVSDQDQLKQTVTYEDDLDALVEQVQDIRHKDRFTLHVDKLIPEPCQLANQSQHLI